MKTISKKYTIIQTNHMGVIDQSYCGGDDQWMMPVYATRGMALFTHHAKSANGLIVAIRNNLLGEQ